MFFYCMFSVKVIMYIKKAINHRGHRGTQRKAFVLSCYNKTSVASVSSVVKSFKTNRHSRAGGNPVNSFT